PRRSPTTPRSRRCAPPSPTHSPRTETPHTAGPDAPMLAPNYFEAMDYAGIVRDYGRPETFVERFTRTSRDELRALQEARFATLMQRAWQVPFYQRLWGGKGIEAGDIRSLD